MSTLKKLSMKNPIKVKRLQLVLLFLLIGIGSCKKENPSENLVKAKSVLSSSSPDYLSRLNEIKKAFYLKRLDEKLKSKDDKNLVWEPDWNNPKTQIINDSVSYVFYQIAGYLLKDGKQESAKIVGAKPFLIVKNEKEFYKGLYYQPNNEVNNKNTQSREIIINHFTGNLLLTNLEIKNSYLIRYKNGTVVSTHSKNSIGYQKLMSVDRKTSYYETHCQTQINSCTYYTYLPSCGGGFVVEYSFYCQEPSYCQSAGWILSDYSIDQVCEDIWFPDPPSDPGSGGGGGDGYNGEGYGGEGNDGEVTYAYFFEPDLVNAVVEDDGKTPIDPKKYIDCFTDGKQAQSYKMTIYVNQPQPGTNAQFSTILVNNGLGGVTLNSNGLLYDVGHTFVGFEKINTDGSSVKQVMGFYPSGSGFKSPGEIQDNSGHIYNISYTKEVTQAQFGLALSSVLNDSKGTVYNLSDFVFGGEEYNCTDAAINWMSDAGINIPLSSPRGLFKNTPGDYGQKLAKINGAKKIPETAAPTSKGPCN